MEKCQQVARDARGEHALDLTLRGHKRKDLMNKGPEHALTSVSVFCALCVLWCLFFRVPRVGLKTLGDPTGWDAYGCGRVERWR